MPDESFDLLESDVSVEFDLSPLPELLVSELLFVFLELFELEFEELELLSESDPVLVELVSGSGPFETTRLIVVPLG